MTGERHLIQANGLQKAGLDCQICHNHAALLCDCVAGDDGEGQHAACHASPFRVAVVFHHRQDPRLLASVFSSLSGQWSPPGTAELLSTCQFRPEPCAIVGNTLYKPLSDYLVLALDVEQRSLATFERPRGAGNTRLLKADGGVLGLAGVLGFTLRLWTRDTDDAWVLRDTIDLSKILPGLSTAPSPRTDPRFNLMPPVKIIGVDEEGDMLFLWTMIGIFMLCPYGAKEGA